jgi:MFS family permease
MVIIYTSLGPTPLWVVISLNVILFVGISARIITSSAMVMAIPEPKDRGAFMSINSAVQQVSGGIAAALAGVIVYMPSKTAPLQNYPTLGYVVAGSAALVLVLMYFLSQRIKRKLTAAAQRKQNEQVEKLTT